MPTRNEILDRSTDALIDIIEKFTDGNDDVHIIVEDVLGRIILNTMKPDSGWDNDSCDRLNNMIERLRQELRNDMFNDISKEGV